MEDVKKSTPPEVLQTSFFLGCFGFSRKVTKLSEKKVNKDSSSKKIMKKHRWLFSWSSGKSSGGGIKTVPVDSTVSDKVRADKVCKLKSTSRGTSTRKLFSSKRLPPPAGDKVLKKVPAVDKVGSKRESKEKAPETKDGSEEQIIIETSKHMDPVPKVDTCQKQFRRKIDAIRSGRSQPGSPDVKSKPNQTGSILRSTSFPVPIPPKPVVKPLVNAPPKAVVKKSQKEDVHMTNAKRFDPVVGMSIVMITLVIMLFWGRLCAILCTSAWFYFIPRFRNGLNQDENTNTLGEPDFDSEEYKKRVVLEGFLERNHRSIL